MPFAYGWMIKCIGPFGKLWNTCFLPGFVMFPQFDGFDAKQRRCLMRTSKNQKSVQQINVEEF